MPPPSYGAGLWSGSCGLNQGLRVGLQSLKRVHRLFPAPSGPGASSLGLVVYLRFMNVCRGFIMVSTGF